MFFYVRKEWNYGWGCCWTSCLGVSSFLGSSFSTTFFCSSLCVGWLLLLLLPVVLDSFSVSTTVSFFSSGFSVFDVVSSFFSSTSSFDDSSLIISFFDSLISESVSISEDGFL
mgnify:CR=1 FL=1